MPVLEHNGVRLSYDVTGTGAPVIFVQGVGIHGSGWRPQVDALRARFTCLTFDNRGIGRSSPVRRLTVEQMAGDVLGLMDACGWADAHLVGHSLGGLVALRVALAARGRVRSLALLCTFARGRDAARSARMLWLGLRSRVGTRAMRRRAFLGIVLPPEALASGDLEAIAAGLAPIFGHDLADHPAVEMAQLKAMRREDVTAELPRLAGVPTLVVSARHDPIAPPALGRAIADGIPGARYELLEHTSHGAPIHDADRVNALLLEHFERVAVAT